MLLWYVVGVLLALGLGVRASMVRRRLTDTLGYRFVMDLLEVLAVFWAVGAVFAVVSAWVWFMDSPETTLGRLWLCQQHLAAWKTRVERLHVGAGIAFAVLCLSALLVQRYPRLDLARLYKGFSWYQRQTKRVALIAAALASFTLFAGAVDRGHLRIEARVKDAEQEYGQYARELSEAEDVAVLHQVAERVEHELPPVWSDTVVREREIDKESITLVELFERLGKGQPTVFTPKPRPVSADLEEIGPDEAATPPAFAREAAAPYSQTQMDALRSKLQGYRDRLLRETAKLLSKPVAEEIPSSAIELLLSHEHWPMLRAVAEHSPLLAAMFEVISKAMAEGLAERVKRQVSSLATTPPTEAQAKLDGAAQEAVGGVRLDWAGAAPLVSKEDATTRTESAQLRRAISVCKAAIGRAQAQRLQKLTAQWEADGERYDRSHVISFTAHSLQTTGERPRSLPEHWQGESAMKDISKQIGAEQSWSVVDALLDQVAGIVQGADEYPDRATRLGQMAFEPTRQQYLRDLRMTEGLGGPPEGTLSFIFENEQEAEVRHQKEAKVEAERKEKVRKEVEAFEKFEGEIHAERLHMRYVDGRYEAVSGIKIGPIEIPEFPARVLELAEEARIP
jgi:hypothetical protein